jgi:gamma-glutamyltranspeptidase
MISLSQELQTALDYGHLRVSLHPQAFRSLIYHTHAASPADNYPEPGKRPLSSTAPTILEHPDGSFFVAIGGSGGSRIFPSLFQVLLNLDWGLDIREAIEFGRLHDQLYPLVLDADNVYPENILDDLRERGHNVSGTVLVLITSRCVLNHVVFHSTGRESRRRRSARRPAGRLCYLWRVAVICRIVIVLTLSL